MSDWVPDDGIFDDDLAFDQELGKRLRTSLESIGPSEEAESRMLANLLAAQAGRATADQEPSEPEAGPVVVERIPLADMPTSPASGWETALGRKRVSQRARRRVVLSIAACLALAALGLGVLSSMRQVRSDSATLKSHDVAMEESAAEVTDERAVEEGASDEGTLGMAPLSSSAPNEAEEAEVDADAGTRDDLDGAPASGGAFDVTSDPSYELVVGHPMVRLGTGELLRIEEHDGEPALIDGVWALGLVGEGQAYAADDEFDVVPCWVYELPVSDDGLYVVRYLEDGSYFAARIVEE